MVNHNRIVTRHISYSIIAVIILATITGSVYANDLADSIKNPVTIHMGSNDTTNQYKPTDVAVDMDKNRVYVINTGIDQIITFDGNNNRLGTMNFTYNVDFIEVDSSRNIIYFLNTTGQSLVAYSNENNSTKTISLGTGTDFEDLKLNPSTNQVFVLRDKGQVHMVNMTDDTIKDVSLPVGTDYTMALAIYQKNNTVFASKYYDSTKTVHIINGTTGEVATDTIDNIHGIQEMTVDEDGGYIYATVIRYFDGQRPLNDARTHLGNSYDNFGQTYDSQSRIGTNNEWIRTIEVVSIEESMQSHTLTGFLQPYSPGDQEGQADLIRSAPTGIEYAQQCDLVFAASSKDVHALMIWQASSITKNADFIKEVVFRQDSTDASPTYNSYHSLVVNENTGKVYVTDYKADELHVFEYDSCVNQMAEDGDRTITDSLDISERISTIVDADSLAASIAIADLLGISDVVSRMVDAKSFAASIAITDLLGISEAVSRMVDASSMTASIAITDLLGISEVVSRMVDAKSFAASIAITDLLGIAESVSTIVDAGSITANIAIADLLGISDVLSRMVDAGSITANIAIADTMSISNHHMSGHKSNPVSPVPVPQNPVDSPQDDSVDNTKDKPTKPATHSKPNWGQSSGGGFTIAPLAATWDCDNNILMVVAMTYGDNLQARISTSQGTIPGADITDMVDTGKYVTKAIPSALYVFGWDMPSDIEYTVILSDSSGKQATLPVNTDGNCKGSDVLVTLGIHWKDKDMLPSITDAAPSKSQIHDDVKKDAEPQKDITERVVSDVSDNSIKDAAKGSPTGNVVSGTIMQMSDELHVEKRVQEAARNITDSTKDTPEIAMYDTQDELAAGVLNTISSEIQGSSTYVIIIVIILAGILCAHILYAYLRR